MPRLRYAIAFLCCSSLALADALVNPGQGLAGLTSAAAAAIYLPLAGGAVTGNVTSTAKFKSTLTPAAASSNTDVTGFRTAGLDVTVNTSSIYTPMAHFENIGATTSSVDIYGNPNTYSPSIVLNNSAGAAEMRSTGNVLQFVISAGVAASISATSVTSTALVASSTVTAPLYRTTTNCSSAAAPAVCAAAAAGSVVVAVGATTVIVNTTAVTANSQILLMDDASLGTKLGVTCNALAFRDYRISARTAATSFTIESSAAPATNPACLSYSIVN